MRTGLRSALAPMVCATICLAGGPARADELDGPAPTDVRPRITASNAAQVRRLAQFDDDVREIVWRPDGSELAFVGWEQPVRIVDPESFRLLGRIGEGRRIIHFAFGKDLDTFAFCEKNNSVHFVTARTTDTVELAAGNPQPRMAFSPDGRLLATGGYGTLARVWSVLDGRLVHELNVGPQEGGLTVVFSPDGERLAVGNRNSTTCIFDPASGKLLRELPKIMSQGLKFDPTGRTLAVSYVDASLALWTAETGELLRSVQTRGNELYAVDWSPAGDVLTTSGLGAAITLWDPRDLSILKELDAPEWVIQARFSPDGTKLLTSGGSATPPKDQSVVVWGVGEAGAL